MPKQKRESARNHTGSFNPSRFDDMFSENLYPAGRKRDRERQQRVAWLQKKGKDDPECIELADKLEECRANHRCKSPACPECAYAAQRLVAKTTRRFLKSFREDGKTVCITIVPADGLERPGYLNYADHTRAVRRWKEALSRAAVPYFIGATDWSFNEHRDDRYQPRWSTHLYGITITPNPDKLKSALKKQFPKTNVIPRPVKLKEWDGSNKALRYMLKPNFWRRVATDDAERFDKKTGLTRSCRGTQKERLRSKQKMELFLHLDKIGSQARLVMRFCQLINVGGTTPTILLREPKAVAATK